MNMIDGQTERVDLRKKTSKNSLSDEHSLAIHKVGELVHHVAGSNTTVLIQGESGLCNELVARSVYISSPRCKHHFVSVHCASILKDLLEIELFGHKQQACSGASTDHKGHFELAHHGTLFLDDIGELNMRMQAKLLRVLQEKTIVRVGDTKPIKVDVRIIAATQTNLEEMVNNGEFQEDLFYCLNVFPIHIPSLRRNAEDFSALVHAITENIKKEPQNETVVKLEAMQTLTEYIWPGNMQELSSLLDLLSIVYPNSLR